MRRHYRQMSVFSVKTLWLVCYCFDSFQWERKQFDKSFLSKMFREGNFQSQTFEWYKQILLFSLRILTILSYQKAIHLMKILKVIAVIFKNLKMWQFPNIPSNYQAYKVCYRKVCRKVCKVLLQNTRDCISRGSSAIQNQNKASSVKLLLCWHTLVAFLWLMTNLNWSSGRR